jgi:hypothetical protein
MNRVTTAQLRKDYEALRDEAEVARLMYEQRLIEDDDAIDTYHEWDCAGDNA